MKKLFIILFLISSIAANATNYYVKNTAGSAGSDAANGDITHPWLTINKVNISTFSAGDTIFFNKGDAWRETLTVPSSGSSGAYVVFSSYGTGNKPKIIGSTELTAWNEDDIGSVAANNNLLSESFEGTGYEHTWATEGIGTNSGCLVDEDNTGITAPTGGGSQVLKVVKVITPTATVAASKAYARYNFATDQPITYVDFYLQVNAHGLTTSGNMITVFKAQDGTSVDNTKIYLRNLSGNIKFYSDTYTGGADINGTFPATGSITLNQWYHIQILYDITNHLYSVTINGTVISSGTLTSVHSAGIKYMFLGDFENIFPATLYYDLVNISSTNFASAGTVLPANVWVSDNTVNDPYALSTWHSNIYFKEINGNITWGRVKKATVNDLVTEYDWTFVDGHICVYAASDPGTRYSGVEVTQREVGIGLNNKEYLSFDGLEIAYSGTVGIGELTGINISGLIVKNCHIHHIGIKSSLAAYGLSLWHSNTVIQDNIIHDSGRRNISLNLYGNDIQVSNIIVEGNVLYHGFHTTGVDMASFGVATIDNVIIRKNFIYDDLTETLDGVESYNSNGIYIYSEGAGDFTNIYIYDNIVKNTTFRAIQLNDVASSFVYNNTIYGVNPNLVGDWVGMVTIDGNTNCTFKNNIIYNNVDPAVAANYWTIRFSSTGTIVSDYNLFYNTLTTRFILYVTDTYTYSQWATYKSASGQDAHSPTPADPLFTSDYHLQSTSPAIDHGIAITGITTDYGGHRIPYNNGTPDIGAYEYGTRYVTIGGKYQTNGGALLTITH